MICCEACFVDDEIISTIKNISSKGDCPLCGKKDVCLYDTEINDELVPLFEDLISIFTPVNLLPSLFPKSEVKLLKSELNTNWNIFKSKDDNVIYQIITAICHEKYKSDSALFDLPIGLAELYDEEEMKAHSLLKTSTWEDFTESLKVRNRFHSYHINLELLRKFCSFIRKPYKKGQLFYRCRLGDENGFKTNEMSAPPADKTTNGRANSKGIRCLYLADGIETTIHETRASEYDYVTIGTFKLKEDIIVVDLKRINKICPFIEALDLKEYALNKDALNKIDLELGKTLRRTDSFLDYIPTQYIADFIRSIEHNGVNEYAGIEYTSVMYQDGYNLAIFDPDLFDCIETQTYKINSVTYNRVKV